jgi:hypothetical protein
MIRGMIDFLAASKEPDYGITDAIKALLVKVSGAQISRLNKAVERLLKINGEKDKVKQPSGQEAGQAQAV